MTQHVTVDEATVGRTLMDVSVPGRGGHNLPDIDVPEAELPPAGMLRNELVLPEVSEVDVVRHFTHLSRLNYSVETGMYPLGSCTMKYNPKVNEDVARLPGFSLVHPLQDIESVQGALQLMYELKVLLAEITGMAEVSLTPAAGAHGELTGILMIKAYHESHGQGHRNKVLVPDSAHGTNPATAAMAGYNVVSVPSDSQGNTDLVQLKALIDDDVAAMMLTIPNTLGLFEPNILEIADIIHEHGALLYGDGANMNALLGRAKPGQLGFDVMHLNLHKTFSTPHGGGGPGAGPVCANGLLAPYLPWPVIVKQDAEPTFYNAISMPHSIGKIGSFFGNFGVLVRAYTYIRSMGAEGLRSISENAVINANYLMVKLRDRYNLKYNRHCMHEVVLAGLKQKGEKVHTTAIAKRLIDYGFHPPTIYFPLIVEEALMIEPTETESRETIDAFASALIAIANEAEENPDLVKNAPYTTPVSRLDEATAARRPYLRWRRGTGD